MQGGLPMNLTILLFLLSLLGLLVALVVVFGRKSDAGLTSAQKVVRFAFRIARWAYAVACGLDSGYLAYRRTLCNAQIEPVNEQEYAAVKKEVLAGTP
jgi:hypothetical protein